MRFTVNSDLQSIKYGARKPEYLLADLPETNKNTWAIQN